MQTYSELHSVASEIGQNLASSSGSGDNDKLVRTVDEALKRNGDVICLLGTAHQHLSFRRRYQFQSGLPRDIASICSNQKIPITENLFGDELLKTMKEAREAYRLQRAPMAKRFHPYRTSGKSFLGQSRGRIFPELPSYRGHGRGQKGPYYQAQSRGKKQQ